MITKAEILSIDYSGNTCTVRIPLFESAAGGNKAIATATFSITPGIYNGYKEGDIVLVAFDDGLIQNPVVIGKLYLGIAAEAKENRSSISCSTANIASTTAIPLTTNFIVDKQNEVSVEGTPTTYNSIKEIIETLNKQNLLIQELTNRVAELEKKE